MIGLGRTVLMVLDAVSVFICILYILIGRIEQIDRKP